VTSTPSPTRHRSQALCPLNDRELAVITGVADGLSYAEIARREHRSASTIRTQAFSACARLGVHSGAQAVLRCFRAGWLDPSKADLRAQETARIADALERIAGQLDTHGRRGLTTPQCRYLNAFDELLRARTDEQSVHARGQMRRALGPLLSEARVPERCRREGDLVERLARYVRAARARPQRAA
jgi:DNA-binding CsgD family transcriptional regulator